MNIYKFMSAGVLALGLGVSSSSAATLNIVGGELVGASGVDVGGTLFDVTFVDGTCVALFGGCDEVSDFAFDSEASALVASDALLDQVLLDGPEGNFDSIPNLVRGILSTFPAFIVTPFAFDVLGDVETILTRNDPTENPSEMSFLDPNPRDPNQDFSIEPVRTWAVWSETPVVVDPDPMSPVPLPAGGILMMSGLAAAFGLRRRRKVRG
jgi:hypothetical protein